MRRILLALGGNALGDDPGEQESLTRETARFIVDLVEKGNQVVVTHGNGPQVGMINLGLEDYKIGLAESIAMSQGYIGYHLQKAIREELEARGISRELASIVTQVLVDENDPAFKNPSKPIGRYYDEDELDLYRDRFVIKKDSNRGYRRFVASPKPIDIVEKKLIFDILKEGHIVLAGGGGGIGLIKKDNKYVGVDGVIDKDFTSELMAEELDMDIFLILTQVDRVYIDFESENRRGLDQVGSEDLKNYIEAGEFAEGSMLPKIEAAIKFVESKAGRRAIISSLDKVSQALEGEAGTHIIG